MTTEKNDTDTDDVPEPTSDESFARAIDELASLGRLSDASRDFIDGLLPKEPDEDEDEDEDEEAEPPVRKSAAKPATKPVTGGSSK